MPAKASETKKSDLPNLLRLFQILGKQADDFIPRPRGTGTSREIPKVDRKVTAEPTARTVATVTSSTRGLTKGRRCSHSPNQIAQEEYTHSLLQGGCQEQRYTVRQLKMARQGLQRQPRPSVCLWKS